MKLSQVGAFLATLTTFACGYSFSDFSKASDLPAANTDLDESTELKTDEEERIIGGLEASIAGFPYAVGLYSKHFDLDNFYFFCGGVLIAPQYVATAEHCTMITDTYVSVGAQYAARPRKNNGKRIRVVERSRPIYKNGQSFDIGLLKLETPVTDQPVRLCAADGSDNEVGTMGTVLGWGKTENSTSSFSMRSVDVEIISNRKCSTYFDSEITDNQLCAGTGNGKNACTVDSGGPLVVDDVLVGIYTGSKSCSKKPGIYTRVGSMLDYINNVVTYGINETNSRNARRST
ncbi:hypothetical protein PHYBOEH_007678 [Phytophthora boehmeriae]|uniref:Peptidase S1 domain-containing protein n=1 Tax=Phytophthora boehmeriae TaxID=109152 RepID=A0A8T1W6D3_9STRA|nr:hypothetical protein PHYBOEH_007678 [Phytophthora boehmeriae]